MVKYKVGDVVRLDDNTAAVRLKRNPKDYYADKTFVVVEVNLDEHPWPCMALSPDPDNVGCNWTMERFVAGNGPW